MRQREIPMSFLAKVVDGQIQFFCAAKPSRIKRFTKGENYEIVGGTEEHHNLMVLFVEAVSRRLNNRIEIENDDFAEIVRVSALESFGHIRVRERKTEN